MYVSPLRFVYLSVGMLSTHIRTFYILTFMHEVRMSRLKMDRPGACYAEYEYSGSLLGIPNVKTKVSKLLKLPVYMLQVTKWPPDVLSGPEVTGIRCWIQECCTRVNVTQRTLRYILDALFEWILYRAKHAHDFFLFPCQTLVSSMTLWRTES